MSLARDVLWRRRLAGVFVMGGGRKNRRRDAGATKNLRLSANQMDHISPIGIVMRNEG